MKHIHTFAALALCAVASFATIAEARTGASITGQASVIDGDTIEIHGVRIRFNGIDAPESNQTCDASDGTSWRCGSTSAFFLADLIGERTVSCEVLDEDRYGRAIADCFVGEENLNARLVREGLAVAYRRYSMAYVPQENAARAEGRGMWQGAFEMPWDFRRRK